MYSARKRFNEESYQDRAKKSKVAPSCSPSEPIVSDDPPRCSTPVHDVEILPVLNISAIDDDSHRPSNDSDTNTSMDSDDCADPDNNVSPEMLFNGCLHSANDFVHDFQGLVSNHNLTSAAAKSIYSLVEKYMPTPNQLPSVYKLMNKSENIQNSSFIYHHFEADENEFFIMNMKEQLEIIISRNDLSLLRNRKHETEKLYDVNYGTNYLRNNNLANNINLILNIDGIPVEKSGNKSFWPVWASIVELPSKQRSSFHNMILCGLWYGRGKPCWDEYLLPLKEQLIKFRAEGCDLCGENRKISVLALVCDLPAKASILNMIQYNGFYGCTFCLSPGIHVDNRHLYPEIHFEPRTSASYLSSIEPSNYGVKGPCVLNDVFTIPDSICIDYMHQCLEGVVSTLIGNYLKLKILNHGEIDVIKEHFFTPNCFKRRLRSFRLLAFWKASELKNFLLYSGPIICFLSIPSKHFTHFNLLSTCISLLSSPVPTSLLPRLEEAIRQYVIFYKAQFGDESMSINVHLLLHLVDNVKKFGPLTGTSAFAFESSCGKIARLSSATKDKCKSTILRFIKKLRFRKALPIRDMKEKIIMKTKNRVLLDKDNTAVLFDLPFSLNDLTFYSEITLQNGLCLTTRERCCKFTYHNCWITGFCSLREETIFGQIQYIFHDKLSNKTLCVILNHADIQNALQNVPLEDCFHELVKDDELIGNVFTCSSDDLQLIHVLVEDVSPALVYQRDPTIVFTQVSPCFEHD